MGIKANVKLWAISITDSCLKTPKHQKVFVEHFYCRIGKIWGELLLLHASKWFSEGKENFQDSPIPCAGIWISFVIRRMFERLHTKCVFSTSIRGRLLLPWTRLQPRFLISSPTGPSSPFFKKSFFDEQLRNMFSDEKISYEVANIHSLLIYHLVSLFRYLALCSFAQNCSPFK